MTVRIQRDQVDVPVAGTTQAPGTAYADITRAFAFLTNNKNTSAGPPSATGDQAPEDMGVAVEVTATNTLTFSRSGDATGADVRASWESWEWSGTAGDDDEFIVRQRGSVTISGVTSTTAAISGITNADDCIVFITGITTTASTPFELQVQAVLNSATEIGFTRIADEFADTTVYYTVVEFIGSGWQVAHGEDNQLGSDTGTIDLVNGFNRSSGGNANIPDFANALILSQHTNNATGGDDVSSWMPLVTPGTAGANSTLNWEFDSDATGQNGSGNLVAYVLYHADMDVTRVQSTVGAQGANNITITAVAGLDTTSLIGPGQIVSGTGQTLGQGYANFRLTSTTNVEMWLHRANGTRTASEIQIVDVSGLGFTGNGVLDGQSNWVSDASGELTVIGDPPASDSDIHVQRGEVDVALAGSTAAPGEDFQDLTRTLVRMTNNRRMSAGPPAATGNMEIDDMSALLEATAVDTLTFSRVAGSTANPIRCAWESWEYRGPAGGDNEFIIRGRVTVTLTGNSNTATIAGIVDIDRCIPFITGVTNDSTTDNADAGSAIAWMSGTDTLNVRRGGTNGTTQVHIQVAEFTGSAWIITHGRLQSTADTGTITLVDDADGVTAGGGDVQDFDATYIHHQWRGNDENGVDDSISDTSAVYTPGATTTSVDFAFHSDHVDSGAGASVGEHFVHCLTHASMAVTRFADTDSSAGANNIDVTSANLSFLTSAGTDVSRSSSGLGTAYGRGWVNVRLTSEINAELWVHRSGNTVSSNVQILDFEAIQSVAGAVALDGQADAVFDADATLTVVSSTVALDGEATATSTASGELTVQSVTVALDGQTDATSDADGTLTVQSSTVALDAQSDAVSDASGELTVTSVTVSLDGQSDWVSDADGTLTVVSGAVALDGQADAVSDASGELTVTSSTVALDAQADAVFDASGELTVQSVTVSLDGQADAVSDASGELTVQAVAVALDGQANAVSDASGELTVTSSTVSLDGQADAVSDADGTLTVQIPIDGQSDWTSDATGTITVLDAGVQLLDGASEWVSDASGELTVTSAPPIQLDGQADAVSACEGELTVLDQVDPCDPVVAIFDDSPGGLEGDDAALWSNSQRQSDLSYLDTEVAFWNDTYAVFDIDQICPPPRRAGGAGGARKFKAFLELLPRYKERYHDYDEDEEIEHEIRQIQWRIGPAPEKPELPVRPPPDVSIEAPRQEARVESLSQDIDLLENIQALLEEGRLKAKVNLMLKTAKKRKREEEIILAYIAKFHVEHFS